MANIKSPQEDCDKEAEYLLEFILKRHRYNADTRDKVSEFLREFSMKKIKEATVKKWAR
jgi:hypothetical protein